MSVTFDWHELVTDAVLTSLSGVAGIASPASVPGLPAAVADVLASLGALPVLDRWPDEDERTALCRRLLAGAFSHALSALHVRVVPDGFVRSPSSDPRIDAELRAWPMVHVNIADRAALEALPAVGPALADRIIAGRRSSGAYRSMSDLVERVSGLGDHAQQLLRDVLSFADPLDAEVSLPARTATLELLCARLLQRVTRSDQAEALLAALAAVAVEVETSRPGNRRAPEPILLDPPPGGGHVAELVVPLAGARYYYSLLELFAESTVSIAVAMFHVALPEPTHPTRQLLDALAAARARGVAVRVILDRDRPDDPYRSTVINAPAKDYLVAAGVECRSDAEDSLLHSKLVVLDSRLVVIGSHNWSAGSYFQFDDLSLAITSPAYGAAMAARFDAMWSAAGP